MARKILHLDLDAFFCAVEELYNPALVGRAFAVGGRPEARGVVASCSYPARRYGVHSAMPMAQALRACPGLLVVPARHSVYRTMSRRVMAELFALTPLVEQLSIDEAFLDVTARAEDGAALAHALQATIRQRLGLPCSLGVATNKLVAKIANTTGKAAAQGAGPPNAVTVVAAGQEAAFLAPLPCDALWGVGPKTATRLHELGIFTIGDLARKEPADLELLFGKSGRDLVLRARALDDRPIETEHAPKSVSQETTFVRDVGDEAELLATLRTLAAGVSRDLRRSGLGATTVKLKLRRPDFVTPTRQLTLAQPTDDGDRLYAAARRLLAQLWQPDERVRLLGVGVSGLTDRPRQMGLFDPPDLRREQLYSTVRAVRARFGEGALLRGSEMAARRASGAAIPRADVRERDATGWLDVGEAKGDEDGGL
jgi:DNA polymerase-4